MNEIFIKCECGTEGIIFTQDDETGDVNVAIFYHNHQKLSIRHKLRWILQIIKGKPFDDQIVMNAGSLALLLDYLSAMKTTADQIHGWH